MKKRRNQPALLILILSLILVLFPLNPVSAQDQETEENPEFVKAQQLLLRLSPEEKVGQLFLITMDGSNPGENSEIYALISDYHIGGMILKRENDNFSGSDTLLADTFNLIHTIQSIEYESSSQFITTDGSASVNDYIPLFVGISQAGDGFPDDQILSEISPIPSQMAIGATWDVDLAKRIGEVLGGEINQLGFNLYLGPSLDLSENPVSPQKDDLAVGTFGGDPYWVGEMGKAYILGVKQGSEGRVAVIAKHFPGSGGSDRLRDVEVATVRKSLEQLKLFELSPFSAVSDYAATDELSIADGFLVSHIRYQGFQGNIRATTKPLSFDSAAVEQLMSLSPFSNWREKGGILVSEDLGSEAIRKFFNPSNQFFDARQIARNAFLAGNDLLYMDDLVSTGDENRFETYKNIIAFFVQKYKEDQAFAEKVDQSLLRILALKYQMYPQFEYDLVVGSENYFAGIGDHDELMFEAASKAATIIDPPSDQVIDILPQSPQTNERITIFTDVVSAKQCAACEEQAVIAVNELENELLSLYGPSGSAELLPQNILSYSFEDLQEYIDNPFNRAELGSNLSRADWIIFITSDQNTPYSKAMQNLLTQEFEMLRDKKVILFAFGAPYYFDATEISAFSAFYGLFSKSPQFFEVAARILFQEISPRGTPPVSIPAISYDLITVTSPDPEQVIELSLDEMYQQSLDEEEGAVREENGVEFYTLGDNLPIKTGVILDHNGHLVPDGTVVRFMLSEKGENITVQQVESTTEDGVARALIRLQSPGLHEIRASSEPALNSQILLLDISEEEGTVISAITPTPKPTASVDDPLIDMGISPVEEVPDVPSQNNSLVQWLIIVLSAWIAGGIIFAKANRIEREIDRAKLCTVFVIGMLLSGLILIYGLDNDFLRNGLAGYISTTGLSGLGGVVAGMFFWIYYQQRESSIT